MIDAVGTNKYAYAVGGQLWTEDGPFANDTVTNSYNNRLRVSLALQQPTGFWPNTFGYDLPREIMCAVDLCVSVTFIYVPIVYLTGRAKRLTNVTSPAGTFSYVLSATQPSTLIHQLALPNTSYITNVYDGNARLLSTTLKSSSHSTLNAHQYTYNPGNQRTQQIFPDSSTTDYTYDKIGQLKIADSSRNRPAGFFDGWSNAFRRYNGRTDLGANGRAYSVNYANRIINRAANPRVHHPLQLP